MRFRAYAKLSTLGLFIVGCGGKAMVDAAGYGGIGGQSSATTSSSTSNSSSNSSSTTSSSSTSSAMGGAPSCGVLEQELDTAFAAAKACDPLINMLQCTGGETVFDACGCVHVANDHSPALALAAHNAYDAWVAAGCGPWDCAWCPPEPPAPWFCMPNNDDSGSCEPAYEK